jgi:hypothetical protein
MNGRNVLMLLAAAILAGAASCTQYSLKADDPGPAAPAVAEAPRADPPPAPRMVTVPGRDAGSDIAFNASAPAITETLEKTVDLLLQAKADNERLKLAQADADRKLADKDAQIQELTRQLDVASGDVGKLQDALEKWKADVLGFRDEMRKADEAEIEVLQEILVLLKGFAKEKPAQ